MQRKLIGTETKIETSYYWSKQVNNALKFVSFKPKTPNWEQTIN